MDHPTELAAILGTDVTTVQRWLRGEKLPRRVRPWPAEAPPVDGSLGAAFRRIWIDAINPATFVASQREMLDETVARWPQQQAWIDADGEPRERALADLVLPEPYSSAYGGEPVHGEVVADNEAPTDADGSADPYSLGEAA